MGKNILEKIDKFLKSMITVILAIVLLIIVTASTANYFKDAIMDYLKQIGELVLKTTTTFDIVLLTPVIVVLILFVLLSLFYYLMRSAHQGTGNPIKWKRRVSIFFYWIGNVYVAILEIVNYLLVFLIGLTYKLPEERQPDESALELLLMPTIWGILLMIIVYVGFSSLLLQWFSREYGGLLTIEELKWNRDIIDLVSTLLFIFAILGTLITVVITGYTYTESDTKWLFVVFMLTITLYVLKMIKNFTITFVETKILK